jgi:hypothetical protein
MKETCLQVTKGEKVPPSRIKYEKNNPPVSFRVRKDIFDRIQHTKSVGGNSFADIFMAGLGKMEARAKKLEEARKQGYDEGYQKGFNEAKLRYRVIYKCDICGQPIEITSPETKEAVSKYMRENSWGYTSCYERK